MKAYHYAAMVHNMDLGIGRIFQTLEKSVPNFPMPGNLNAKSSNPWKDFFQPLETFS